VADCSREVKFTFKYNPWGVCERPIFEACRSNLQTHKVKTHIADAPCLSFWFILGEISHDLSVWPRISMPSALMFQCHSLHPPCCQVRAQQLPFSREWNCCLGVPLLLSHTGIVKSLIISTFRAQIPKISGNFTLGYWFVKLFGDDNEWILTKEYERNIATDPATHILQQIASFLGGVGSTLFLQLEDDWSGYYCCHFLLLQYITFGWEPLKSCPNPTIHQFLASS
jgi:hypothetical protein